MTHGLAFVLGTGQGLVADLVTRGTLSVTAFPVAEVELAVAKLLALCLAPEGLHAADFTCLKAAVAALLDNLFALEG